jgi:uncharacterized phage protein (TIGR01671 family)
MKREVKFRGWHTELRKMFSADEMTSDQLTLTPTGSFINVSSTSTRLSTIYPDDKFIPLQFTGLTDKNGKEIYDGDILKYLLPNMEPEEGETEYIEAVSFVDGAFCVDGYTPVSATTEWNCEIIGNIYENAELLFTAILKENTNHP